MASLYKQKGSDVYWIKIYRAGRRNKPDRFSLRTSDPDTAKKLKAAHEGDIARGIPINPRINQIEFWQLCEMVLEDYENREFKSMKHAMLRFNKHIVPFLGPMTAAYITEAEIRKYETSRRKAGAAKATIRRELELVKRAFTLGRRAYKIQGPYIELPKIQNARSGFFEEADFLKIMAVIEEDKVHLFRHSVSPLGNPCLSNRFKITMDRCLDHRSSRAFGGHCASPAFET